MESGIDTTNAQGTVSSMQLAALIGVEPSQKAALRRWLIRNGIVFFEGRLGPWTTLGALDAALRLSKSPEDNANREMIEVYR